MTGVIVDYFAGGGGWSTGLEMAYGRPVTLAVNHDLEAIAMHAANHPETEHACCDVFEFDLVAWLGDRAWDVWATSPDCTHHSRAKGGKPVSNKRRALADVVVDVVERLPKWQRPRVIHLENVPEWLEWGPLGEDGRPDKARKGEDFNAWRARLAAAGYDRIEWRIVVAADYGDPTTRKRVMLIARCDGLPIVWPDAMRFNPKAKLPKDADEKRAERRRRAKLKPWRTAAECIDWSIPGRSIFGRTKKDGTPDPLADATLQRVARGTQRFVIDNPKPFLVPMTHHGARRNHPLDEPFPTVTCAHRGELAIVEPFLAGCGGRAAQSPEKSTAEPLNTTTTKADQLIVVPHLVGVTQSSSARNFAADAPVPTITTAKGGELMVASAHMLRLQGSKRRDRAVDEPLGAVCSQGGHHAQVAAFMAQHNVGNVGHAMSEPVSTIITKGCTQGVVELDLSPDAIEAGCERVLAFMIKYYGAHERGVGVDDPLDAITTKDRFALITVHIDGVPYRIFDIRIRMLTARELFNAQGFPPDYIIDPPVPLSPLQLAREVKRGSGVTHKTMSKSSAIAKCGNSVPPGLAYAHAKANAPPFSRLEGDRRWKRAA